MIMGMEEIEVGLLTKHGNDAVVHMPERRFPGVLIQGDTLHELWRTASLALSGLNDNAEQSIDRLTMVVDDLAEMLGRYERALSAEGMTLPYPRR